MKLGLLSHGFAKWGGGIDFIRYIASSVASAARASSEEKHSLILPSDDFLSHWKRHLPLPRAIRHQLPNGRLPGAEPEPVFSTTYLKNTFSDFHSHFEIIGGGSTLKSQLAAAQKVSAQIVLPCIEPLNSQFSLPWVGYLCDFQHRHLPELFSSNEIQIRNQSFSRMLNTASHVIVNSKSVSIDAQDFHKDFRAQIHVLPFCPCPQQSWLSSELDVRDSYNINKRYFIICNQFWKHKDHSTAFRAFARFLQSSQDAMLVCTGQTSDYRNPNYFAEMKQLISDLGISSRVLILGHIPKRDQISLLKNSLGLIQPTLFEGGPGGGSGYDAISLGVPVIASDITVNREITCGDITFFRAGDDGSLADALRARGTACYSGPPPALLWKQGVLRRKYCGEFILNVAEVATKGN